MHSALNNYKSISNVYCFSVNNYIGENIDVGSGNINYIVFVC